jgi:hypothetical protein
MIGGARHEQIIGSHRSKIVAISCPTSSAERPDDLSFSGRHAMKRLHPRGSISGSSRAGS